MKIYKCKLNNVLYIGVEKIDDTYVRAINLEDKYSYTIPAEDLILWLDDSDVDAHKDESNSVSSLLEFYSNKTKGILDGLKFTMEMFLFDPSTGEVKNKEQLNDMDRTTYDACEGAYTLIKANSVITEERIIQILDKCLLTATATDDYKRILCHALLSGLIEK